MKFRFALLASLVVASGASAAESEDTRPPELASLSISPTEVDVTGASAKVTVTARVEDNLSGVNYVEMTVTSSATGTISGTFGTNINGNYGQWNG